MNLKINVSFPFRCEGQIENHPYAIFNGTATMMQQYIPALKKEIKSIADNTEKFPVYFIEFDIGSYCQLLTSDVESVYELLQECFLLTSDTFVQLHATPAAFSFYRLMTAKHLNAEIYFEIPCFNQELLEKQGYQSLEMATSALEECFNAGYRKVACELDPSCLTQDAVISQTVEILTKYQVGRITFNKPLSHELNEKLDSLLLGQYQFNHESYSLYTIPTPSQDQLGFGLGSLSIMNNEEYRNTTDFDYYIHHPEEL